MVNNQSQEHKCDFEVKQFLIKLYLFHDQTPNYQDLGPRELRVNTTKKLTLTLFFFEQINTNTYFFNICVKLGKDI